MKVTILGENLVRGLREVKTVMPPRTRNLPILLNTHMSCSEGCVKLTSTNLEVALTSSIAAFIEEDGEALLPISELLDFIGNVKDKVVIEQKEESEPLIVKVPEIKAETKFFNLATAKDFPPIPEVVGEPTTLVDINTFRKAAKYVSPYVANNKSRPILTGVCCEEGTFTAADGFRLANYRHPQLKLNLPSDKPSVIVPAKVLFTIAKVMEKEFAPINVTIDNSNYICIEGNKHKWVSQLIQGRFPDYTQLIPRGTGIASTLSAPLLAQRLSMLGTPDDNICRIQFFPKDNYGILSAHSESQYHTEIEIPANVSGDCKVALQLGYITWATKHFSEMTIEIYNPTSPVKITGDIEGLTLVIMPMFVQW